MAQYNPKGSLAEEKVYAIYKNNPPARVIKVDKYGKHIYLLLRWENSSMPDKWVKDTQCTEYTMPETKKKPTPSKPQPGKAELNWWQKLIIHLQNKWNGTN